VNAVQQQVQELFAAWLANSPFARLTGLRLEEMEPERAVVAMPYSDEVTTFGDVVHGGAIATLVDVAAVAAAWSGVTKEGATTGATVSSSVNYLRAARGTDLVAHAKTTRRGRSFCFCEVSVYDAAGDLVAQGLATYKFG
jgi:uncharacterized protein (TIGR00369 family)